MQTKCYVKIKTVVCCVLAFQPDSIIIVDPMINLKMVMEYDPEKDLRQVFLYGFFKNKLILNENLNSDHCAKLDPSGSSR